MSHLLRRLGRWLALILGALVVIVLAAGGAGWIALRRSLPQREETAALAGLQAEVTVAFDALGVPAIRASSRDDLAQAIGYLHAQDRFFQMDLLRREAAGELAELIGPALVKRDRAHRLHRFRDLAGRVLAAADPAERRAMERYTAGVNAGLASLGARPFEYLALRQTPVPWRAEDCILVTLAMFFTLNDEDGGEESSVGVMHDVLPAPLFDFLAPEGTEWDAPIIGAAAATAAIPGPEVIDLRANGLDGAGRAADARGSPPLEALDAMDPVREGSNNWAVAGSLTATGGALLANDMHLGLDVPNIWYRASFVLPDRRVTGVTLPGAPVMVVGSNGAIAWGYTNSYGDWVDLVELETDPSDPETYRTPEGPRRIEHHQETVRVAGAPDETLDAAWTVWGPIVDQDHHGRRRAARWIAHDLHAVNARLARLETVRSVAEAMEVAPTIGIPPQNFVVADAQGHIGWTIIGAIPRRVGFSSAREARRPSSWADGARGWDGWLETSEYPRVVDPPSGRIWTANARVVDGESLRRIGDGGYDLGARAAQIRDDLMALSAPIDEADMLRVQLDDRAVFLRRWHDLLLATLTSEAVAADPRRARMRALVEGWGERAAIESAGYRLVRAFRQNAARQILGPLSSRCREADPGFDLFDVGQYEAPLWALVTQRPAHMLEPGYPSWDAALLAAADAVLDSLHITADSAGALDARTWGERNTTRIVHPLAQAVPALAGMLGMPPRALPGDAWMPRVQAPSNGASERMAISPGHEESGYFHMPGGQSGHPLSPHFGDGHAAWEEGQPTPFLPGPAVSTLVLRPAGE